MMKFIFVWHCLGALLAFVVLGTNHSLAQTAWTEIPCTQAKVATAPSQICYQGSANSGNSGNCFFEQYIARGQNPDRLVYARAFIAKVDENPGCFVTDDADFPNDLKAENDFIKANASKWSALTEIGGVRGMRFEFPKRKCFAYLRNGSKWGGGYLYRIYGYVCGATTGSDLTDAEITTLIASVEVKAQ
jgi:hypothetical protein